MTLPDANDEAGQASPTVLVHVTTVPETLDFLEGQIVAMTARGFTVHVVSSPGERLAEFGRRAQVEAHALPMRRRITPGRDLWALARLVLLLRRLRPRIVHAHTPKGGLLGIVAAWLAGVPLRVYTLHGLPLMTASGPRRRLLWWAERVSCGLAHEVLCVSRSLREVAMREGVCPTAKLRVLGAGSTGGVDAEGRFDPGRLGDDVGRATRARLGIPTEATVIGFVGRIVRDKGIVELVDAWRALREERPGLHLLLVGPFEPQDPIPAEVAESIRRDPRIHAIGPVDDTAPLYAAIDVLALPTYREGLSQTLLEAAAMGLPVVASRVTGCVDPVLDGTTGTLVPARDASALAVALRRYLDDPALRQAHGQAGREFVLREFRPGPLWEATSGVYERLLSQKPGDGVWFPPPLWGRVRVGGRHEGPLPTPPHPGPPPQGGREEDRTDPSGVCSKPEGAGSAGSARPSIPASAWSRGLKRSLDVAASAAGLVVAAPAMAAVALAIRLAMGRPVLFRQVRPGLHEAPFVLVKFRTMRRAIGPDGSPLPDQERLTRLGAWLRRTSLDELPQLWNVLKGEMSLVGPRPLLPEYLPYYSERQRLRHAVRPGITGLAQVGGRNLLDWGERLELDARYVEAASLGLDLRILGRTARKAVAGSGVGFDRARFDDEARLASADAGGSP